MSYSPTSHISAGGEHFPEQARPRASSTVKLTPVAHVPRSAVLSPNAAHRERQAPRAPLARPGATRSHSEHTAFHSDNSRDMAASGTYIVTRTMTRAEFHKWQDAIPQLRSWPVKLAHPCPHCFRNKASTDTLCQCWDDSGSTPHSKCKFEDAAIKRIVVIYAKWKWEKEIAPD